MGSSKAPVFFLLLSALIVSIAVWPSARAQTGNSPVATATHVPITIPKEAPPGWDQTMWANLRQRCQEIADETVAHVPLSDGEMSTRQTCFAARPHPTPEPQILNGYWSGGKNGKNAGNPVPTPQATGTPSNPN